MLFFSEGFTFRNFLADAFAVFMFVLWFWLLIIVISDLFRRHDVSGWVKAIWVIALIVFPYLGIFAYIITQSRGMAERSGKQAEQARDDLRRAAGFSPADEIEKLHRLGQSGLQGGEDGRRCGPWRAMRVALPPGRGKLATKPAPPGSTTTTNTIGTVRVACSNGARVVVPEAARIASGATAANSTACLRM